MVLALTDHLNPSRSTPMEKVLTLDVCVSVAGQETVFDGLTPQEAFNLLMMPAFASHITALIPNWKDAPDGVSPVHEPAN